MAKTDFTIWVNEEYYWALNLTPEPNECEEPINRCALINSKTQQEIEAINFDAEWLIPIFQCRSKIGMQELATKLKEITDKRGIIITPKESMPTDKRRKETIHIGKKRELK